MNNKTNRETISTRVPGQIKKQYREYAEERKHSASHYYRMAIYNYMEMKQDFEVSADAQLIMDNVERYDQSEMEQVFFEYENQIISQQIKKATFLRFMDNFIAEIYLKNIYYVRSGEITRDQLVNLMKNSLEELENRAEHHGYVSAFESRMEEPVRYARNRIADNLDGYDIDLDGDVPDLDDDIPDLTENSF